MCDAPADIAYLVDSSGSISRSDYIKMKHFIVQMTSRFHFSQTNTRAAVILFGSDAKTEIDFASYDNIDAFRDAVTNLPHYKGMLENWSLEYFISHYYDKK